MEKVISVQVIEDNGGGLHLYCFDKKDNCIAAFSGFENETEAGMMRTEVEAAVNEGVKNWDNGADDPQADYDNMRSCEYVWTIIGGYEPKTGGYFAYPGKMGFAGSKFAGLEDTDD